MQRHWNARLGNAWLFAALGLVGAASKGQGAAFVDPAPGYTAAEVAPSNSFGGFDASGGSLIGFANGSLDLFDLAGNLEKSLGVPTDYFAAHSGSVFNGFVRFDPSGSSAWVGFTVGGNVDDRIYEVGLASGAWTHRATLPGNYDLDFSGANVFVSGLNNTTFSPPNGIWLLDTSGGNNHDLVASVDGFSAGLAFDATGNLYYATNEFDLVTFTSTGRLVEFSAAQVASAIGGSSLLLEDGTKLADLPAGAFDTAVDGAGNIVFDFNGPPSAIGVWNGTLGDGANFVTLATGNQPPFGNFLTYLAPLGDITQPGGSVLVGDFNFSGLARVAAVPEVKTLTLASLAGLGTVFIARRRVRGRWTHSRAKRAAFPWIVGVASIPWLALPARAGIYSAERGDPANLHDPGIPAWIGPDGDGFVGGSNLLNPLFVAWASGYVDYIPSPGVQAGFQTPSKALGPATGDNLDTVSLGDLTASQISAGTPPGRITLTFGVTITDGIGADFAVFENGFVNELNGRMFVDLAYVDVSTDGIVFARFPSDSTTAAAINPFGTVDPTDVYNLAGKHFNAFGESWGTPFDLAQLATAPEVTSGAVDLAAIHFIRIVDIPGSGAYLDASSDPIYDPWPTVASGGFDLEAVGVIHAVPEIGSLALGAMAVIGLVAMRRRGVSRRSCASSARAG